MFNLMFGPTEYKRPVAILGGVDHERIGRFRDLWVEQIMPDSFVIAIYTRTGGNNRADYQDWIQYAQSLPTYIEDADDGFDNTYATFRFRVTDAGKHAYLDALHAEDPEETGTMEELREVLRQAGGRVDTDARWQAAFAAMSQAEGT
jgi:hypothetical protein